ncbi:MAG: pyridoxal-dependent decarboxylase, partial [Polyangiaceae bacterium]|nr:pyridoxal-dependent decarboxylase [Polyangiaceae bacterium]
WAAAPGALEIEQLTLRFLAGLLGLPEAGLAAHFTNGGAEANLTAVVAALARAFPAWADGGVRALDATPTVYLAQNAHDSLVKAVRLVGLGRQSLRSVPITARHELDVDALAALVAEDRRAGCRPLLVVGTAGATSTGAIDPLAALAQLAAAEDLWFHVDAAWGGAAAFSPRLRPLLEGIERADSVVWDAHKWLAVPLAAGMFFCRHPDALRAAFRVSADYIPPTVEHAEDPFTNTVQWSRRALGLKVFMALAELGRDGYTALVEGQTALGDVLRARLRSAGWLVVNDAALPVVLFTHPRMRADPTSTGRMLGAIYGRGRVLITDVTLPGGERVLRACITSYHSDERDLDVLFEELDFALGALASLAGR